MDFETRLSQFTGKRDAVFQEVAKVVLNEEKSWYAVNRGHKGIPAKLTTEDAFPSRHKRSRAQP